MASLQQEYPLVLLGILEELSNMRHWLSFQDLCRMVSTRFDLAHLIELRSLLFAAASQDPCFPATLFRDRVTSRGLGLSPIGVAADIVTMFNLIQMTGVALDESQPMRTQVIFPGNQSLGRSLRGVNQQSYVGREKARTLSDSDSRPTDQELLYPASSYSSRKRGSLPPDPISLLSDLSSTPPTRARAVSFDWPHNTPLFPGGQIPSQAMKNIYLPLETDSESSGDSAQMEVFEPEQVSSAQKRNIFKKDFHNQPPLIPQVTVSSESPSPGIGPNSFDNHSFEMLHNPYPSPTPGHTSPEHRAKHESLDGLHLDSTYFGPGSVPESSPHHLQPSKTPKSIWNSKSHSLEDRISLGTMGLGMESPGNQPPRRSSPAISKLGASTGWEGTGLFIGLDGQVRAMGTQTDPPDPRLLRSIVQADRLSFMTSLDDPEFGEDDISAIFRFLDDMSMCGSTGVLHHNDGTAPINQDTPEARRGRLGQLQRLFHSLESSDDGIKASVCKLLLRMSQIERQLESLTDVKTEIGRVLSTLQRLDDKIPIPQQSIGVGAGVGEHSGGRWLEPLSAGASSFSSHPVTPGSEISDPQPLSVSGHLYPATSTSSLDWSRWNTSGVQTDHSSKGQIESKGVKEGKRDASLRRAAKSQSKEKSSSMDYQRPSVSTSARDWPVSFSKSTDSKDSQGKTRQMDQSNSTTNLLSQKPKSLMDQVFNSALFGQKESSLMGGMASGKIMDPRLAEGRGRQVWTVDERESRISPMNLQTQESLNPNNMEFWMEDIYTPGYDALLRRKEASQRRVKFCKVAALIATAVAIILVIVVPICTMRS